MSGRKWMLPMAAVLTAAMLTGCGEDVRVDEAKARNWYNEMQKNGAVLQDDRPDGYGVYSGGPNWGTDIGSTDRNTYGMRKDGGEDTLGEDIRNAWDTVKNDVKNMGSSEK